MFHEEKWKEFQAKQPIYAVYAREKTMEEVNHLESPPPPRKNPMPNTKEYLRCCMITEFLQKAERCWQTRKSCWHAKTKKERVSTLSFLSFGQKD